MVENESSILELSWPEDYLGKTVGNIAGFDGFGGDAFWELVAEGKIIVEETETVFTHIKKLASGRVDCIMINVAYFNYQVNKMIEAGELDESIRFITTSVIGSDPVYLGYSEKNNPPYAYEFRKAFDNEIYTMIKSGEINEIIENFKE